MKSLMNAQGEGGRAWMTKREEITREFPFQEITRELQGRMEGWCGPIGDTGPVRFQTGCAGSSRGNDLLKCHGEGAPIVSCSLWLDRHVARGRAPGSGGCAVVLWLVVSALDSGCLLEL